MVVTARGSYWANAALGYLAGLVVAPLLSSVLAARIAGWYGNPEWSMQQAVATTTSYQLTVALDQFRADRLRLPDARDGLRALLPAYLDRVPVDPWGNPYVYNPTADGMWADVLSYGADGASGGTGSAGDISGRFGYLGPRPPWLLSLLDETVFYIAALVGWLGINRWQWAGGLLAGSATLCAVLLLGIMDSSFNIALLLPFGVAVVCLVGSVAVLRRVRGAPVLTIIAVVVGNALLSVLTGRPG
jgi:general secretion pathway protein G